MLRSSESPLRVSVSALDTHTHTHCLFVGFIHYWFWLLPRSLFVKFLREDAFIYLVNLFIIINLLNATDDIIANKIAIEMFLLRNVYA